MRDHDETPTVCSEVMRDGTVVVVARGSSSRSGAAGGAPAVASCDARGEEETIGETSRAIGREEKKEEEEEEEESWWAAPAEVLAEAAKLVLGAEPVAPAAAGGVIGMLFMMLALVVEGTAPTRRSCCEAVGAGVTSMDGGGNKRSCCPKGVRSTGSLCSLRDCCFREEPF